MYARGNNRQLIYRDDLDYETYLGLLARVTEHKRWRLLAYCLMKNHVHLLIETREPNLAAGMHRLHSGYAQLHNARHERSGHLFQGRYGSVAVRSDAHLWTLAGYIARNPVEAGFCERPEEWRWSGHSATLDGTAPPWLDVPRLLSYFAATGGNPRARYAELVATGSRA